jgi:tRNA A37 threonylcarbamoyladenosine biosynthesis protein TsaE
MKLHLENDTLTIELEWSEQLWAFMLDRQLRIPLARIDSAKRRLRQRVTTAEPESN